MNRPDLSIVIGFRDWGAARLRQSVAALPGAVGALDAEVIISDYGSADPSVSRGIAEGAGVRWVHTPGDPVWSRSRALNAGFAVARGDLLVSTDADMLFAPGTLEAVHAEATAAAPCAVFLQCRDLDESSNDLHSVETTDIDWDLLEHRSRLRPRWGMGGMMAIDREGFSRLHGFDERLHTYGREDLDFALRARRAGWRTHWVRDSRARMFHMWHPPTLDETQMTTDGRDAIIRNRRLVDSDTTTTRNLTSPSPLLGDGPPLVSIVVVDVGAREELHHTVMTALAQSVQDIEVIIAADEPAADGAPHFTDDRVRWAGARETHGPLGLPRGVRGVYVSIVRSGEVLPLDRTEALLSALTEGHVGVQGLVAIANQGDAVVARRPIDDLTDSTLLIRDAMELVLNASTAPSVVTETGSASWRRIGLALAMCDAPVTLALHARTPDLSKSASISETDLSRLRSLLPADHPAAVRRRAALRLVPESASTTEFDGDVSLIGVRHGGTSISGGLVVDGASYSDLATLARGGHRVDVEESETAAQQHPHLVPPWIDTVVEHAVDHGASLPLAFSRIPVPSTAGKREYTVQMGDRAFSIVIPTDDTDRRGDPWLLIGSEIEEVWA